MMHPNMKLKSSYMKSSSLPVEQCTQLIKRPGSSCRSQTTKKKLVCTEAMQGLVPYPSWYRGQKSFILCCWHVPSPTRPWWGAVWQ